MLILTRKIGESIIIGDNIEIVLSEMNKSSARIGIRAPKDMPIYRKEIYVKILEENRTAAKAMLNFNQFDKLNKILTDKIGG